MRQLDTCDFCGDAPEGVFEVVPASVADGPVRLALCADCRSTLQTVVDPLLDADESAEQSAGQSAEQSAEESAEQSADQPTDQSRGSSTDAETDGDGVTIQPSDARDADQSASNTGDRSGSDAADRAAADEDRSAGGSPARRPDGYAQVIRLLQNREGAMPREDLRALATNAYDLREPAFEDAVDAAIENGDVEEAAGGLRTT
ncbi:MAG: hypothetical protein ABEJ88_04165, partial [Halobacterium sp.]